MDKFIGPLIAAGVAIAGFIVGAVSWLVRLERRLNSVMTVAMHQEICQRSDLEMNRKIDAITALIGDQNKVSAAFRHDMRGALQVLSTKFEVQGVKLDHVKENQEAVKSDLNRYQEKVEREQREQR